MVLKKEIKADLRPGKHNIQPGGLPVPARLAQQGWPRQWSSRTACHMAQPCGPSLSPSTFDREGSDYLRSLKPHVQQEARGAVTRSCLLRQPALLEAHCRDIAGRLCLCPTTSGVKRLQLVKEGLPHCHSGSDPVSGSCSSLS